jgi:uncharacterized protein YegJ (DUF2314 family)
MAEIYFSPDPDKDPEMQAAIENAQATFRFFLRELVWENHRIVPGLDLATVKIPFRDPPSTKRSKDDGPEVEQMWINEVRFDGKFVRGVLINSPHWLKSVKEGDDVEVPISGISDWMYAINRRVYGAYTVNQMRKHMSHSERRQHDNAWGLNFGDPDIIHVVPAEWSGKAPARQGFLGRLFGQKPKDEPIDPASCEHPMALNMADSLKDHLKQDPASATKGDERGWTHLHDMTVAGSDVAVSILLKHGANPNAETTDGITPRQIAKTLGWTKVASLLAGK